MTPIHPTDLSLWPSHTTLFHISELLDILFLIPGICLYSLVFLEKHIISSKLISGIIFSLKSFLKLVSPMCCPLFCTWLYCYVYYIKHQIVRETPDHVGNIGGSRNFPLPTDTPNIWLYMEQFPLREIQNQLIFVSGKWENTHKDTGRKS